MPKQKQINLVYLVSSLIKQGPNVVLFNLLREIDFKIYRVSIMTFKAEASDSLLNAILKINKEIMVYQYNKGSYLKRLNQVNKKLKEITPNIVHSSGFSADVINILSKSVGQKKITTVHSFLDVDYKFEYGVKGLIIAKVHLFLLRYFDKIVACSDSVKEYLNGKGIFSQSIRNGVATSVVSNKYHGETNRYNFVFIGRLMKRKRIKYMLDEFLASKKSKDSVFYVVGSGPQEFELKEKYASFSNIIFTGFQFNPFEYVMLADYLILVSLAEGLPMVALESLSVGTPLILSNIAPHREIYHTVNSGTCYLVDESLVDVFDVVPQKTNEIKLACQEAFNRYFSSAIMAEEYQNLYKLLFI